MTKLKYKEQIRLSFITIKYTEVDNYSATTQENFLLLENSYLSTQKRASICSVYF